jgi:hypothetical protein
VCISKHKEKEKKTIFKIYSHHRRRDVNLMEG